MQTVKTAYSYVRFSTPEQQGGDSLRRQDEAARKWCEANGVVLDESLTLRDLGKSAFTKPKGRNGDAASLPQLGDLVNPDRRALAGFFELIRLGRVPRGAHFLIENLDRLSRDDVVPATHLLTGILLSGVSVVQLSPVELALTAKSDPFDIMRAVLELSRGNSESRMKSERNGKVWAEKRKKARESGTVAAGRLPAWVERTGDKLSLVPARAEVVKNIFGLAASGYGIVAIVERLTGDGVPPFVVPRRVKKPSPTGRSSYKGAWTRSTVAAILADGRALGAYQPTRDCKPEGAPIPNYYPAVITQAEYDAARLGAASRRRHPGREGKDNVYLFSGLLMNAAGGDHFYVVANRAGRNGAADRKLLMNADGIQGTRKPSVSFPLVTFERTLLSMLAEVDPDDVLRSDAPADEMTPLANERNRLRAKMAELEAELLDGDIPAVAKLLRDLGKRDNELTSQLDTLRRQAACPLSNAWSDTKDLLGIIDTADDPKDVRLRLRGAIRRVVSEIWLLVVGRGRTRIGCAQVWFQGGDRCRSYVIVHRGAKANGKTRVEGSWHACSLADVIKPGSLDLRRRVDAEALAAELAEYDMDDLLARMQPGAE